MKKLVRFLEKTYLTLKVGEVKLCLHENSKHIVLNGLEKPSLETSINLIALHAGVERGTLKMALHLKEIFVSDFVLKVAGSRPRNSAIDQSRMHGVSSASALGHYDDAWQFLDPPVAEKEKLPSIIIMALRNLKIMIKRIHVRYEDDYYAGEKPFSFGLMIDVRSRR